ncbi:MAG: hypothetical protein Athens101410_450 [Parcubacteria group bacterium Athens1014_10]|nr:MAG: hypothetical protein Athens101410_450 [Parcubacteria group bacterium Athens1014_10]TSD05242.1 MAG: hypothetical protein Athens071412_440 [Parcubacteria group bacterium Athens0714_12]
MTENNQTKFSSKSNFFFGFFAGLAIFSLIGFLSLSFAFKKANNQSTIGKENQETNQDNSQQEVSQGPKIISSIGTFGEVESEICKDGDKPIIRLFSSTTCPHCVWIKKTFDKVAKEYVGTGKIKAYHWELDQQDNTLTEEKETQIPDSEIKILTDFNPEGYVPVFIFGCKYFRIGTGYERENDLAKEEAEFKEIIDELLKS